LRWHGAEEVEHRAVAFDACRALGVGWPRRYLALAVSLPVLVVVWVRGVRYLAARDGHGKTHPPRWREFLRAGRQGRLPTWRHIVRATLRFASPAYDPRREASTAAAHAYLSRSRALAEAS
jgi:predicted metal-dependent hydrolase